MTVLIELQGGVVQVVALTHKPQPPNEIAKRGKVVGFSRACRRRMVDFVARLDLRQKKVVMLTLTFSRDISPKKAKIALNRFLMRTRRGYPNVSGMWRMEATKIGRPHFHLLLFDLPFVPQRAIQRAWEDCTGEDMSRVDIRFARGLKRVMAYVSKYIAKVPESDASGSLVNASYLNDEGDVWQGRVWGYLHKSGLPIGERYVKVLTSAEAKRYFWWGCRSLSRGRSGYRQYSAKLYSLDSAHIFAWCCGQGCEDVGDWLASHEHLKRYPTDYYFLVEHFLERST